MPNSTPGTEQASGRKERWAPAAEETIGHTASRHSSPRAWLRALERAVAAGLLPGFNDTTAAIIAVLAARMDYGTGHCRYMLQDVMESTGLGRTAVTDHVKMLRAGGWLAWVEHGSLRNALRVLGMPGYAKTATVYAATIPPAYDVLEGNILNGRGYEARVVGVTPTARERRVEEASRTPSLRVVKEVGQVQVVGGEGTTTADAAADRISSRRKRSRTVTGYKITPGRIEQARHLAKRIRPLVNWVQGATLDQLSWVLLDLVARDWHEGRIVAWLAKLGQEIGAPRWRPRFPHRVIAAALQRRDEADARLAEHGPTPGATQPTTAPNAAFAAARQAVRRYDRTAYVTLPAVDQVPEDMHDRGILRDAAAEDLGIVRSMVDCLGREEALRVLGSDALRAYDTANEAALVYAVTA
ncbi:MAG: hypothetical protein HOY79_33600 [Streptomyces sp.]|nr:hypothetical protein [Streptomyces sp.]NUS11372.1 hypothetical protein [Streptomyces sp.]NUS23487.1 hypothetical protein [Streptomyces sp.]